MTAGEVVEALIIEEGVEMDANVAFLLEGRRLVLAVVELFIPPRAKSFSF